MSVIMRILDYIAKTDWKHNDVVVWDDVNRWETAIDNHNQFLNRYSWLPKKAIKKSSVLLFPFDLSTILIAQNAGTTGTNEPNWEQYIQEDGTVNDIVDGDIIWKAKQFVSSDDTTPIGTIEQKLVSKAPPGWVIMQGGLYNRAEMPLLWTWIQEYGLLVSETQWQTENTQNGSCAYYSTGNGSTTFRIPNLNCFARGGPQNLAGTFYADQNKQHKHDVTSGDSTEVTQLRGTFIAAQQLGKDGGRTTGVFSATGILAGTCANKSDAREVVSFNADHSHKISIKNSGTNVGGSEAYPKHVIIPFYLRYDNL